MRAVTFYNPQNKLKATFSTDTPMMFLENFNGNSCGAEAITQKPLEFDGQRLISANLNARTIELAINFGGIENGRYSRKAALEKWDLIQKLFVPGVVGTLTWTDGEVSRFIRCRTAETPDCTQILPFLYRAEFQLVADLPLWYDTAYNVEELSTGYTVNINNDCGIAVPFTVESYALAGAAFSMYSAEAGAGLGFTAANDTSFVIDTAECTVRTSGGELINYLLGAQSEFFRLLPGNNRITFAGVDESTIIRWHRAYMGVK